MPSRRYLLGFSSLWVFYFALSLLVTGTDAAAQQETVLHSFIPGGAGDGAYPYASLVFDAAGNLYGTTTDGGGAGCFKLGCGVVFELTPDQGGGWTETTLHNFNDSGRDGQQPTAGLVFDPSGDLYGATRYGGTYGCGTIFELIPQAGASWIEKTLHSFNNNGKDGCVPHSGVILDASGNVFGTTEAGGIYGLGTAFEVSHLASGEWSEKLLHTFGGSTDGWVPNGLVFDTVGNLYGTTQVGDIQGVNEQGSVFELLPQADGKWKEKLLVNFPGDGGGPKNSLSSLIFDSSGNLYGSSNNGGANGAGSVFELSPKAGGGWTVKVLHSFEYVLGEGQQPVASLIRDAIGNLYGTTSTGGTSYYSQGIVFRLTPHSAGAWTETLLYSFSSIDNAPGSGPNASLIIDSLGDLYGTTVYGGANNGGTVFEVTP